MLAFNLGIWDIKELTGEEQPEAEQAEGQSNHRTGSMLNDLMTRTYRRMSGHPVKIYPKGSDVFYVSHMPVVACALCSYLGTAFQLMDPQ